MKKLSLLLFFLLFLSCQQPPKTPTKHQGFRQEKITPDDVETITPQEAKTFHQDKKYEYEYRTGISGEYEYNYAVKGFDAEGNDVSGNINTNGKQGAGILTNKDGIEHNIQTEWTGYGKLKATDDKGIVYELEAQ